MKNNTAQQADITVEIVAVWPERTVRQILTIPHGMTIEELHRDHRLDPALQSAWQQAKGVGVFGEKKPARAPLADGDRVELWRELIADPKEARRERAKAAASARKRLRKPRQA